MVKWLSMRCLWNTHITTRTPHNSLRILERPASLTKLITLMNAVARGASFRRDRRGQERHLHEARPHVNSWVRIRSRLRRRCWDIWCSSHLRRRKRRAPATRIGADPLENQRESERRDKERERGKKRSGVLCFREMSPPRFCLLGGGSQKESTRLVLAGVSQYAKPHTCLTS